MHAEKIPPSAEPLPIIPDSHNGVRRWTIKTSDVNHATEEMPEDHRSELRWLHAHAIQKNLGIDDIAGRLKKRNGDTYSRDSVYQALTGRREAGLTAFIASIAELRREVEARASVGFPFVEWPRSQKIFDLCEMAFTFQDIVFIYGRSHSGKTEPLKQYARLKPFGRVVYLEMAVGGALSAFRADLAEKLGISPRNRGIDLNKMIREALDPGMIIIVDQFHRAVAQQRTHTPRTLDYVMHLRDERGCGIVLCGTPQARVEIENKTGANAEFYRQLINRSVGTFVIDDAIGADDLALFSKAVGLPKAAEEALDLQTSTIQHHSLGKWIKLLRAAMRLASNKKETLTWDHVIKSNRWLRSEEERK